MVAQQFQLRKIEAKDNPRVAQIIRQVMTEFDCVGEGYSINDPEVDDMHAAYAGDRASFFVLTNDDNKVIGCGGIAPLEGGDGNTCELQKMYFLPEARGKGQGRRMLETCLDEARDLGYKVCYLETVDRMAAANKLYQKVGFQKQCGQMGCTGHSACETFYTLDL